MGGEVGLAKIKCSVQSCHFYDDGDICTAEEIYVRNMSAMQDGDLVAPHMEIGTMHETGFRRDQGLNQNASRSNETCCETFRPKGAAQKGDSRVDQHEGEL